MDYRLCSWDLLLECIFHKPQGHSVAIFTLSCQFSDDLSNKKFESSQLRTDSPQRNQCLYCRMNLNTRGLLKQEDFPERRLWALFLQNHPNSGQRVKKVKFSLIFPTRNCPIPKPTKTPEQWVFASNRPELDRPQKKKLEVLNSTTKSEGVTQMNRPRVGKNKKQLSKVTLNKLDLILTSDTASAGMASFVMVQKHHRDYIQFSFGSTPAQATFKMGLFGLG